MCIFCEIANGNIPCYKVYEDDVVMAFLDLSQATRGHTLVVPKKHFENIFELDSETSKHIFDIVRMLSKHICASLNVNDVNIVNNNGELAGQTVKHFHIHIIPRYENDGMEFNFASNKLSEDDFKELLNKIKY